MRGQGGAAERDRVTIFEPAIDGRRREGDTVAEREVARAAALDEISVGGADQQLRAGAFLQRGKPAGVIAMPLRVEQELDVRRP